jgi:hypothetical protein
MYKILVRPVLPDASETWPLRKSDERLLSISERRILRYIFGPMEEKLYKSYTSCLVDQILLDS